MRVFYEKHKKMLALLLVVAMVFSVTRPGMLQKVSASGDEATVTDAAPAEEVAETDTADVTNDEVTDVADNDESVADSVSDDSEVDDADESDEDEEEDDPTIMAAKTLHVRVEESKCDITINAPEGSLPYAEDELSVSVKEFTEGSVKYDYYLDKAANALDQNSLDNISFARFFDIEILRNGEKIEPALPVEVKIEYENAPEVADSEDLSIVHFASSGIEVIDDVELNNDASEITYEQDSFSVTATLVTTKEPPAPSSNPNRPLAWKEYALIAEYNGEYYIVEYDGSLKNASKSGDNITADRLLMWIFANEDGKYYLRTIAEGYDYNGIDLSTTYGYTYIDPTVEKGLSTDVKTGEVPKEGATEKPFTTTVFDSPKDHCAITIDDEGHIKTADNKYLSVENGSDGLKLAGNSPDGSGVRFILADAENLPDLFTHRQDLLGGTEYGTEMARNNQVNHIDISIEDSVTATIPLIYGTYYYKNSNDEWQKLVVNPGNPKSITVTKDLNVTQKTMRNATIIAYDSNGNELNNAYVIDGYSSNSADNNNNTVQVRIEGVFKVSTATITNDVGPNDAPNTTNRRREKVTYSIYATQPDVTFDYDSIEYGQLYDINKQPLSITTDVELKKENFGFFESNNTCPAIDYFRPLWEEGGILDTGTSGMDFKIEGSTDIQLKLKPVAINVYNDLRDSSGNIIKPAEEYNDIIFNVKQDYDGKPSDVASKNVSNYSDPIDVSGYTDNIHKIDSVIDKTGSGLVYDYNVFPGMVNVEEDINTVPKIVVDQDGNTWFYRYSYIETEYVNREDGNERKLHVGDQYQSNDETAVATPEVLGNHKDVNNGDKFSEFVEFFAHNVYDKVIPPTKEEVSPYQGNGELGGVCAGDQITYSINYTNYSSSAEDIVIKDKLDENVEFVSASNGGTESDGVVTWSLDSVPAGQKGSVTLTVKVLETALESNGGPGTVINGGDTATVQVGNDPVFTLDEVLNPVTMPSKMEVSPYEGNGTLGEVSVAGLVTYEITYKNYKDAAADIVITDKLDPNVEFVEASDGGKNEDGTVKWTLSKVPAGKEGSVTLTVKVLRSALSSKGGPGEIVNGGKTSTVKVGNDKAYSLDLVKNPVVDTPETLVAPHKREVSPYVGNGKLGEVKVGEKIVYEISYTNYLNDPADIVIVDKLDANVEFVEASDDGVYDKDAGTVTWTIKDVPSEKEGKVTLTVKVLESALAAKNGPGKVVNGGETATVQVGNDAIITLEEVENPVITSSTKSKTDKTTTAVKTGDSMPIIPIIIVMAVALVGIISVIVIRRKKAKNEPEKNK